MARKVPNSITRNRGAVLVEMVVVTPLLLFLMMATAEITRAFIDHNTLTKAVRNGARYAVLHENAFRGTTGVVVIAAAVRAETRNLVVYGNIAGTGTPVLPGMAPGDVTVTHLGGNNIEISADYLNNGILGPILPNFFGGDINLLHNLEATVTMRAL